MDILIAVLILALLVYVTKSLIVAIVWIVAACIAVGAYRYIRRGRV